MASMKTHTEVEKLTIKMNFDNSFEPHKGSKSFPNRRPMMLIITWNNDTQVSYRAHSIDIILKSATC
jgi:hypothetical protein